uniref:Uncharacterized protein n=1 Tax=Arundo donax TaxID=35708 RepID=A0A0A8YEM4_ARUDO
MAQHRTTPQRSSTSIPPNQCYRAVRGQRIRHAPHRAPHLGQRGQ